MVLKEGFKKISLFMICICIFLAGSIKIKTVEVQAEPFTLSMVSVVTIALALGLGISITTNKDLTDNLADSLGKAAKVIYDGAIDVASRTISGFGHTFNTAITAGAASVQEMGTFIRGVQTFLSEKGFSGKAGSVINLSSLQTFNGNLTESMPLVHSTTQAYVSSYKFSNYPFANSSVYGNMTIYSQRTLSIVPAIFSLTSTDNYQIFKDTGIDQSELLYEIIAINAGALGLVGAPVFDGLQKGASTVHQSKLKKATATTSLLGVYYPYPHLVINPKFIDIPYFGDSKIYRPFAVDGGWFLPAVQGSTTSINSNWGFALLDANEYVSHSVSYGGALTGTAQGDVGTSDKDIEESLKDITYVGGAPGMAGSIAIPKNPSLPGTMTDAGTGTISKPGDIANDQEWNLGVLPGTGIFDWLKSILDAIKSGLAALGNLLQSIIDFFANIGLTITDAIVAAFTWAFVIDTTKVANAWQNLIGTVYIRIPLFQDLVNLIKGFFNSITFNKPAFNVTMPKEWGGETVSIFNLDILDPYISEIRFIIGLFLWLSWAFYMIRRLSTILGRGS